MKNNQITISMIKQALGSRPEYSIAIQDAMTGDKDALSYLRLVYKSDHCKSAPDYNETRRIIIQLDEMGTLDSN